MKYIILLLVLFSSNIKADLFSWTNPKTGTLMMFDSYEKLIEAKQKYYKELKIKKNDAPNIIKFNIEKEFNEIQKIYSYIYVKTINNIFNDIEFINSQFYSKKLSVEKCIELLEENKEKCSKISNIYNNNVNDYKNSVLKFIILKIQFFETAKNGGNIETFYNIIERSENSVNKNKKFITQKMNELLELN